MATTEYPLLDQLQAEVNRVLEQTGRIFSASNKNPDATPTAQMTRLKNMLPESMDRFHQALDQLEDELQVAKLVMRRDLVACRERAGMPIPAPEPSSTVEEENSSLTAPLVNEEKDTNQPTESVEFEPTAEVSMTDAEPEEPAKAETELDEATTTQELPSSSAKDEKPVKEQPEEPTAKAEEPAEDSKPADIPLHIDTKPQPQPTTTENDQAQEDEKPPDTGTFSNTNDLESLFGGPTSAGPDFNMDNDATDFDFASFGNDVNNSTADNDNLSALLPGLQDYANNQAGASDEPDFDALFSTDMPGTGEGQDDPNRDTTFDDLMNFADFGGGDFTGGNGGDANGGNADQDFDFSFD